MKVLVDSNCLRHDSLNRFLKSSDGNIAVLPDYAAMEALKGNPLVGMYESMKILADYPAQVQLLKTTMVVCGLSGCSHGLQRRLVDFPVTRDFGDFCRNLRRAKLGFVPLVGQLEKLGEESRSHFASVEAHARGFAESSLDAARIFTADERAKILASARLQECTLRKLLQQVVCLSEVVFGLHPAVTRAPTPRELINTYIFRSSISHLLLGFEYASVGGVSNKAAARIRNDMVDSHFATYATFFDGFLTQDILSKRLYVRTNQVLSWFKAAYRP